MTENEAIKILYAENQCLGKANSGRCKINCGDCKENIPIAYQEKAYEVAISALKEVQQYRVIGTVEECKGAVEKQIPKRPVWKKGSSIICKDYADGHGEVEENKWADWTCPVCGWFVGEQYIPQRHNQRKCNYCSKCGQAIQWENLEGMEDER